MRVPSKQAFKDAKAKAAELGKPVIVGWHIFQSLRTSAQITLPKHGKASDKSLRWFRQHFRDAWVVLPDGTGYDVFDLGQPQCI